jgi:hypothetical protein
MPEEQEASSEQEATAIPAVAEDVVAVPPADFDRSGDSGDPAPQRYKADSSFWTGGSEHSSESYEVIVIDGRWFTRAGKDQKADIVHLCRTPGLKPYRLVCIEHWRPQVSSI